MKKVDKEKITKLYSTDWWYEDYTQAVAEDEELLKEKGLEGYGFQREQYIPDYAWEDLEAELKDYDATHNFNGYAAYGSIGTWRGTFDIRPVFKESLMSLVEFCVRDVDHIEVYVDDGNLHIGAGHHDGSNHFVMYGCRYLDWPEICDGNGVLYDEMTNKVGKDVPIYSDLLRRLFLYPINIEEGCTDVHEQEA